MGSLKYIKAVWEFCGVSVLAEVVNCLGAYGLIREKLQVPMRQMELLKVEG